jgi:ribosome-associated translation inhibitor RaiA
MEVIFESRDPAGMHLRDLAERRVRFVMRRMKWLIPRARVRLSDVNGPRGGEDKSCRLEIKTDHIGMVAVTTTAQDWRVALDHALARASRMLLRNLKRTNSYRGSRSPAIDFQS